MDLSKYSKEEIEEFERLRGTTTRKTKGRGGSNKFYSQSYPECHLPYCHNTVAAIEMNHGSYSVTYCKEHSKGIKVKCTDCSKEFTARASDCIERIMEENLVPDEDGFIPVRCHKCFMNIHNKSDAIRSHASELGKKTWKENLPKAWSSPNTYSKEAIAKREATKRKNGFYDEGGGLWKGLQKRKENGSFQRFLDAAHTSEAASKANRTRWSRMTKEERVQILINTGFIDPTGKRSQDMWDSLSPEERQRRLERSGFTPEGVAERDRIYWSKFTKEERKLEIARRGMHASNYRRMDFSIYTKEQRLYLMIARGMVKPSGTEWVDGELYYDNSKVSDLIPKWESGELSYPDYFNKMKDVWYFGFKNLTTGEEYEPLTAFEYDKERNKFYTNFHKSEPIEVHKYLEILDKWRNRTH